MNLVERCKQQMSSSLLRLVDEKLYTSESSDISLSKQEFIAYHDAYEVASEKWPIKPIDHIVKFIKKRIVGKKPIKRFKFADVGCGREPLLKTKLGLKARVQSYDLVSTNKDIVEANMDKLPLEDQTIDCAVYSLSLMAKNLGSIIIEAKRVLKLNGSLLIVEVSSRFQGHEKRFVSKLEALGLKKKSMIALKPNGYFTFFHFTKIDCETSYSSSDRRISLKPCMYKSR